MVALAEVQLDRSRVVDQSSGSIHFNHEIMLQGPELSRDRLREYVEKFAGEHFFKATKTIVYFDGNDWYHQDGEPYSDFFDRGITHHSANEKLRRRFSAEEDGYNNAKRIVNKYIQTGDNLPTIVINSPPGDVYLNDAFVPRIVYYLLKPICERTIGLGNTLVKDYQEFELISVPKEAITTREQWDKTNRSTNLERSLKILKIASETVDPDDPNMVVSLPLILEDIVSWCNDLEYANFEELEEEASNSLRLEEDQLALERRKAMVEYFTNKMWGYINRRDQLREQERQKLKSITDVMHYYLSAEGGGEYLGMQFEDVEKLIEGHTLVEYRNAGVTFTTNELRYTNWEYAEMVYADYFMRLRNNPVTQERLANAGCPVNVNQSLFDSRLGGLETYTTSFGYDSTMTDVFADTYSDETTTTMDCVTCPFCHETVDAIVTSTRIKCPKCEAEVSTG